MMDKGGWIEVPVDRVHQELSDAIARYGGGWQWQDAITAIRHLLKGTIKQTVRGDGRTWLLLTEADERFDDSYHATADEAVRVAMGLR
jgi:hypothetical protein